MGRVWVEELVATEEVKVEEGESWEVGGFVGENMGDGSTGLARE
jgi:hypothetical protein